MGVESKHNAPDILPVHGFDQRCHAVFLQIHPFRDIDFQPLHGGQFRDGLRHSLGLAGKDNAFSLGAAAQPSQVQNAEYRFAGEQTERSEGKKEEKGRTTGDAQLQKNDTATEDEAEPNCGVRDLPQRAAQRFFKRILVKTLHLEQQWAEKSANKEHPEESLERRDRGQQIEVDDLVTAQGVSGIKGQHQDQTIGNLVYLQ